MNNTCTCNYKKTCLRSKKLRDAATSPTIFEQTPVESRKKSDLKNNKKSLFTKSGWFSLFLRSFSNFLII